MWLKLLVIASDSVFQEDLPVYKIFVQYNIVLSAYEFNHSIRLTPRSRVGCEMEKVLIVTHFFYYRDATLGKVSSAANIFIVKIFFLSHEILQYILKFLFTDSHGSRVCITVNA